jgi:hypothetical protein
LDRALTRVAACETRIADHNAAVPGPTLAPISSGALAEDLHAVWSAPTTDARLKKRIVRTLIHEAVADLDDGTAEIVLTIHWVGGTHTEHRLPRHRRGQRTSTSVGIVEAVRTLALIARDDVIAGVLNRNGLKTGHGNRWTRERVTALRSSYRIPVYREDIGKPEPWRRSGATSRPRTHLPMGRGSSAGLLSMIPTPEPSLCRSGSAPNTPQYQTRRSKASSPQ